MTDTQKALDALPNRYGANEGDYVLRHWFDVHHETIKAALEAKAVDVEALKEPPTAIRLTEYSKGYGDGWNKCIEHLAARGMIQAAQEGK